MSNSDGNSTLVDTDIITCRDVSLGFGLQTILQDVSLNFPVGTITALVGPSGSGKTTFLRSLNRLNDRVPNFWRHGEICFHDWDIQGPKVDPLVLRRKVGMVFQRPNPFPMSIEDNVTAGVRAHKLAKRSELHDLAETRLAEVGLWSHVSDRLSDSPFRLSGGQQQLLCLARALAVGPEVLLLDEPTSSLDPRSTEAVEELVRRLKPQLTVIIVTHNLAQARRLSDRTVFFYGGRLVESGPTSDLFEHPERPETARYLGGDVDPAGTL
ncbi:MAG TPA: phosphate ABC transporter ATP-binding protein [Acidimicrobiales bacterium]|nr:phosphate ABC transporter ATP-binding protein [Acidimicrobiales bacterium]